MRETREQYLARKERQRQEYERQRAEKRERLRAVLERKQKQFEKNQEFRRRLEDNICRVNDERYLAKGSRKDRLMEKLSNMQDKKSEVISQGAALCHEIEEIRNKLSNI